MKRVAILLFFLSLTIGNRLYAEEVITLKTSSPDSIFIKGNGSSFRDTVLKYSGKTRPKIGLTLGGGGAKGAAHIGVLKLLEEIGIPIDYVTGTSMGSIIGGLHAIGYSSADLEKLVSNLDWPYYMNDAIDRGDMTYEAKLYNNQYLISVPFNAFSTLNEKIKRENSPKEPSSGRSFISSLPSGIVKGQNILNLLNSLCVGYQDSISFDSLPIPFACVATDLLSAKGVVLRSGVLPMAIRASMAIPGYFAPVKRGEYVFVDGGMANNFPVDVCKELGADIVIGVEVTRDIARNPDDVNSLPELLTQLMSVATNSRRADNRKQTLFYMHPYTGGYGMMSFDHESIETLIRRGYIEALDYKEQLLQLKAYLDTFQEDVPTKSDPVKKGTNIMNESIMISSVELSGVNVEEGRWLLKKSSLLDDNYVSGKEINEAIALFYGTNCFSSVNYTLLGESEPYQLKIVCEKEEPHRFGLGFRFDSEETAAILLSVGINTHKLRGFKFDLSGRLSISPWAKAEVQYVSSTFPKINLSYMFRGTQMTFFNTNFVQANTSFRQHNVELSLSEIYSRRLNFKCGIKYEDYILRRLIAEVPDDVYAMGEVGNYLGTFLRLDIDTQDDFYFPTKGVKTNFNVNWYFKSFLDTEFVKFGTAKLTVRYSIPLSSRVSLLPSFYGRSIVGARVPILYANIIGGLEEGRYLHQQMPFLGFNYPIFVGNNLAIARLDLRVMFLPQHYISACFNYGMEYSDIKGFFKNGNKMWGAALQYSYKSPIGPISLNLTWSNQLSGMGAYFNLGYYF